MKGIIIYKSTYGSTKQYAEWLKEDTGFQNFAVNKISNKMLADSEVVIIGSPVLAHRPFLANWIKKKWNILKDKKVVLYTTSGAPASDPKLVAGFKASLDPEISSNIKYVPQGGRMIFSQLKPFHRFMMKLGMRMEKDPKVRAAMAKDKDGINRDGLKPILEYVK